MALSDLAVYSEYAYTSMTEVLRQQVEKFNAASNGAITLRAAANQGDYNDKVFFQKISNLVRRRNPYGSGAVAAKSMVHLVDTMVKIAAGTPPVRLDPGQYRWIQQNPEVAGAALGQQLAVATMADMLNTAIMSCNAALSGVAAVNYDATSDTPDTLNPVALNNAAAKFGDRSSDITCWVTHSVPMHNFYGNALTNTAQLFKYDTVNVMADPFGRLFIVSDITTLFTAGTPNVAYVLGLVPGGVIVEQNNDFDFNVEKSNGDENIISTYQAEWSYNLGIKGFAWDKTNGGHAPDDTALAVNTNWDKIVSDNKDLAGVRLKVN